MDWFTSDLHLDHLAMLRHRPRFSTIEEMNETILKAFDVVNPGDRVFILGDVGWKKETLDILFAKLLKKRAVVFWIEGNHDTEIFKKIEYKNLHKCQTHYVKGYGDYEPIFLSHYPHLLWNKSYQGTYMLHGHGHEDTSDRQMLDNLIFGKRLNVNIEMHDYKLWSRDEVEAYMSSKPKSIDFYLTYGTDDQKVTVVAYLRSINSLTHAMYKELKNI